MAHAQPSSHAGQKYGSARKHGRGTPAHRAMLKEAARGRKTTSVTEEERERVKDLIDLANRERSQHWR